MEIEPNIERNHTPEGLLTQELARELWDYIPETGQLIWKHRPNQSAAWNARYSNQVAGHFVHVSNDLQYRRLRFGNRNYLVHRVIWIHQKGEILHPETFLDHIDGNGLNNRISNLRKATPLQNNMNCRAMTRNKKPRALPKGVDQVGNKYRARIRLDGKLVNLGLHETAQAANEAYFQRSQEEHGEFARAE